MDQQAPHPVTLVAPTRHDSGASLSVTDGPKWNGSRWLVQVTANEGSGNGNSAGTLFRTFQAGFPITIHVVYAGETHRITQTQPGDSPCNVV